MRGVSRRDFFKVLPAISSLFFYVDADTNTGAWEHLRTWNLDEFYRYSKWVGNIYHFKRNGSGKQKMARLNYIIKDDEMNLLNHQNFLNDGNPQISDKEANILNAANHCGSFPMLLFLYYSYRRGLPCLVSKIKMESGSDIRYSKGNHPIGHVDSLSFNGDFGSFIQNSIFGGHGGYNFVSGNFRTDPNLEKTDSVPISIDRSCLMPGTMCYNANGHCLVVGHIEESGEVHFLDAHPDHSITFNQTLSAIPSVKPAELGVHGLKRCYDGFRNIRLAKINNGRAVHFTNEEMIPFGYSILQYKDMAKINSSGLIVNGQKVSSYPDYVRACLRTGKEKPLDFLENSILEFAEMMKERVEFVEAAWNDVLINGPITFPNDSSSENIYQANGRWEVFSSPSSDVDRKNKYNYITTRIEDMLINFDPFSRVYDYSGFSFSEELAAKLMKRKEELFSNYFIVYKKSNGGEVSLTLSDIEKRLFDLSFDPNHPPEIRWGAPAGSDERLNMKLISTPLRTGGSLEALEAYELEKGLRYYPVRQSTPTSLNPENNPKEPPFKLFNEVIGKYLD
ncbi:MAG: hypothetical protein QXI33_01745 [Candidatus Pacearchaeota archaeon]